MKIGQNTKCIALLFGQNLPIFTKIQCDSKSVTLNFGENWSKYQVYSLTFWSKSAHFHHFSISTQNQSHWILVKIGQNTKSIALLFGQNLTNFHQNSMSTDFEWRLNFGENGQILTKCKPYFLVKICPFSPLFNLHSFSVTLNFGENWAKYQVYSLTFWSKSAHFHHFSISTHFEWRLKSGENGQILTKCKPYFLVKFCPFSPLFNLHSFWVTLNFGENWAKYQVYSLTFWSKSAHFHHFSISTQNQSHWILMKIGQNTKCIALLFGQNLPIFTTFQCDWFWVTLNFDENWSKYQVYSLTFWSKSAHFHHFSISTQNQSHWILVKIGQNTKCIALLFGQNLPIFTTFQSPLILSHIEFWWKLVKIPSVSLTFWSKSAHFHHFSISTHFESHWILMKIGQNTKCIALLFGQNLPIFTTFQSPLKISHIEFSSKLVNFDQK